MTRNHAPLGRIARRACALAAGCAIAWAAAPSLVQAGQSTSGTGGLPRTTGVNLDFTISIDKFIFFRIGDGFFPTPGGTISSVNFTLTPAIPGGGAPAVGNNTATAWNGTAPIFSVAATGNVLPVEVRSNAGQITLRATATTPLTSGANTIPLSEITIASNAPELPAPTIPDTGNGPTVNVTTGGSPGGFTQVTQRTANWTFSYANSASRAAGSYAGQVTFTAASP